MSNPVVGTVEISMPDGNVASIDMTQDFINMVCAANSLSSRDQLNETHVRSFLVDALTKALQEVGDE